MNRTWVSCAGAVIVFGWTLACSGVPSSVPAEAVPAPSSGTPELGAVVGTDPFAGAGCTCSTSAGAAPVFLSNGTDHAIHVDGADHRLQLVSDDSKPNGRISRYSGDGYDVTLKWKVVDEGEGGANYDVRGRVIREGGGTLETQLSCGCSF